MLIKESELTDKSILSQLDEAVYLTQEEADLSIKEIPIIENNGYYLVDSYYLNKLSEQGGDNSRA
jgi:hypothetical protein